VATGPRNGQAKKKTAKVAPKYRNPDDPGQTWTGRGRKPNWLVAELEAGRDQEDFRIG
jgi:DNA-binding protein H-NS